MEPAERLQLAREWLQPRWPRLLGFIVGLAFLCYLAAWVAPAFENWSRGRGVRELAAEAKRHDLTYREVVQHKAVGWTVRWELTHPAAGQWSYGGEGGGRVEWSGAEPDLPFTGASGRMNSVVVVANVVEVSQDKVVLSYQGKG